MNPELNALIETIKKKRRHTKRRACSAGIDDIRNRLDAYLTVLDLERSWWYRAKRYYLNKSMGVPKP